MNKEYNLTKNEAKKFLLYKQGLIGDYRYHDENDIVKFIENVACIQYDPVDVCGKNAEIILLSRIENFKKEHLYNQLYKTRTLIEYWDKNMSIMKTEDFKYFARIRAGFLNTGRTEPINDLAPIVLQKLEEVEFLTSKDLEIAGKTDWYWSETRKAKAILEALYYQGKIVIHHRKGAVRYFSLPTKLFNDDIISDHQFKDDFEYLKFRVFRRIKGVGLLSPKPSYAYIAINGLTGELRKEIFETLEREGKIIKVKIEGFTSPYYLAREDEEDLIYVLNKKDLKFRTEFLAPLDNLLWDREFIKKLFDFDYTWEIYYKEEKRKYGYYVLPVLYGIDFIGRIDLNANRKENVLELRKIFMEPGVSLTEEIKERIGETVNKFAKFNEVENVKYWDDCWVL